MDGRQVAKKVWLKDISAGKYVRVEGEWEPNFVQTADGRTFSRANVIAIVASEPLPELNYNSFVIDDGTARVPVRIFNDTSINVKLGDPVLVIGRPREFNQEIYLVPEVVKLIENKKWIEHRKLELGQMPVEEAKPVVPETAPVIKEEKSPVAKVEPATEEVTKIEEPIKPNTSIDSMLELISKMDTGDGADTEEVIATAKNKDAEQIIDNLLKEGEIFEITSGKIKVLE